MCRLYTTKKGCYLRLCARRGRNQGTRIPLDPYKPEKGRFLILSACARDFRHLTQQWNEIAAAHALPLEVEQP